MNYKDPEVLAWLNEIRVKDGRKPLKRIAYAKYGTQWGKRAVAFPRSENCPIARSLGPEYHTSVYNYVHQPSDTPFPNPLFVRDWISNFDCGDA